VIESEEPVSVKNQSADIVELHDARAKRQAAQLPANDYDHVGAHLAAVREGSGLMLEEVAAKTHIKEPHLTAIEAMDVSALPSRPYAIGFVKTYAEFLGLDSGPVVIRFKEDAGYSAPPPIEVEKFEASKDHADTENRDMSFVAVAAVVLFIIWCAWQITRPHEVTLLGVQEDAPAGVQEGAAPATPARDLPPDVVIIEAVLLEKIEPVYPRRCAPAAQAMETIIISYNVTAGGRVAGERIAQSSNACFDNAALNAIKRWQFSPRMVDGLARPAFDQKYSFAFARPL